MPKKYQNGGCFSESTWKMIGWVLFVVLLLAILYSTHRRFIDSPYRVEIETARQTKYDVYLDVRTPMERDTLGYYPNSINIPSGDIAERIETAIPNKNASILVYCNTGHRAKMATEKLRQMGYRHAYYIAESHIFL